jgi:hypothetical protein
MLVTFHRFAVQILSVTMWPFNPIKLVEPMTLAFP